MKNPCIGASPLSVSPPNLPMEEGGAPTKRISRMIRKQKDNTVPNKKAYLA
jgi:hypothetical protein